MDLLRSMKDDSQNDAIQKVLQKMKQKSLKFAQFDKEKVLELHIIKPHKDKQEEIEKQQQEESESNSDDDKIESDKEDDNEKDEKDNKNDDKDDTKLLEQIPGVGKYNPRFKAIDIEKPAITISKAYLDRTRNLVTIQDYTSKNLPPCLSKRHHISNESQTIDQNHFDMRSKSEAINKQNSQTEIKDDQDDIMNNNSQVQIEPYKDLKSVFQQKANSITPGRIRPGWNKGNGLLSLNKQSQRKFVFENMIRVNDERFNYIQLPMISSKSRKVTGDAYFSKVSPRRELFKVQPYQPMYSPNYDLVQKSGPKYVNMNVKNVKDIYHNI